MLISGLMEAQGTLLRQKHTTGENAHAQEAVKSVVMLSGNALSPRNRMNCLRTR